MKRGLAVMLVATTLGACGGDGNGSGGEQPASAITTKTELGEALFSDVNLSANRNQSCATCHNPDHAFSDDRKNPFGEIAAVSTGDDGTSLGVRNAPTATYAAFAPEFHKEGTRPIDFIEFKEYQGPLGGQFVDGRAQGLAEQAMGPPVNPIEMGMADKAAVVTRLQENPRYVEAFQDLYGEDVLDDVDRAYRAMADSIAVFERTEEFAPFDSRYDRALEGDYEFTPKEKRGRDLFFSRKTNCFLCHQRKAEGAKQETFTGYEYHNIGVPANIALQDRRSGEALPPDAGLLDNPEINDEAHEGKFKVPTLRNVAVTEPYMHNGVFQDLETVVAFYDHMHSRVTDGPVRRPLNPETGDLWGEPEVDANIAPGLAFGNPLDDGQVEALVCFLRTLTDRRYEHLIEKKGIACGH